MIGNSKSYQILNECLYIKCATKISVLGNRNIKQNKNRTLYVGFIHKVAYSEVLSKFYSDRF